MMTLSKFEDPNPSVDYLRTESKRLKDQANQVVEQTKIMDIFAKYGKLSEIGGSYKYNLMVYSDLDIGLIKENVNKKDYANLTSDLAINEYVRCIGTTDTVNFPPRTLGRPKGYWVGLEVPFEGDRWGIDCWLQQSDWLDINNEDYTEKLAKIDQSSKDSILMLKYQLIYKGLYGRKYYSGQVYDAVIKNGPLSMDQFISIYC